MSKQPTCDTPGCGRTIPKGGEGHPEICPTCLACLQMHGDRATKMLPGPGVPQPEMTVEWQVIPGDTQSVHIFTSEGAVFGFLASEWKRAIDYLVRVALIKKVSPETVRAAVEHALKHLDETRHDDLDADCRE